MKKLIMPSLFVLVILAMLSAAVPANASTLLSAGMVHAIVTNPISIFGKTYDLHVDNKTYPIYYGFNFTQAMMTEMHPVPEKSLIQMTVANVTESDAMWVYIPQSIISAEGNNFVLYVDGRATGYELATYGHSTILGFMVPVSAHTVEIQGTRVIPEFPIAPAVMAVAFAALASARFFIGKYV